MRKLNSFSTRDIAENWRPRHSFDSWTFWRSAFLCDSNYFPHVNSTIKGCFRPLFDPGTKNHYCWLPLSRGTMKFFEYIAGSFSRSFRWKCQTIPATPWICASLGQFVKCHTFQPPHPTSSISPCTQCMWPSEYLEVRTYSSTTCRQNSSFYVSYPHPTLELSKKSGATSFSRKKYELPS